jgi:predicted phage terminase large subunit-like protein
LEILSNKVQTELFDSLGLGRPTSSETDEFWYQQRQNAKRSLYYFTTAVLNWTKLRPSPHLEVCNFIQQIPPRRKVCLIPRDCYKSTIGSKSFPLWILIQDDFLGLPGLEHRILLCSHSSENSKKQIKSLRQQIERNQMLRWLFPEIVPDIANTTWTDSNLLFPRNGTYGEDTIEAAGIDTHLVSRHYTVQIKDDLEDHESYMSPTVRQRVKEWYRAAEALFVDEQQAFDLLIGTRWGIDDLYAGIYEHEYDTYHFLCRPLHWTAETLQEDVQQAKESSKPPIYNMAPEVWAPDAGKTYYFFPELFPEDSCRRIRAKQGNFMYSMLYMNNPKDPELAEFKSSDIRWFTFNVDGDIQILDDEGKTEIVYFDSLRRVLFWDPALSSAEQKRNARNAMVVMAKDKHGRLFVLDAWAERKDPSFLFTKFLGLHRRYTVHQAAIEDVAFQRILKFPLYAEMRRVDYHFPVREQRPVGAKEVRIRSLIPYAESHLLFVRRGLTDFVEELKGFPVFPTVDLLDAAAATLEMFGQTRMTERDASRAAASQRIRLASRSSVTGY